MISFDKSCIQSWDKRIVYAPNGFGKTLSSLQLKEVLEKGREKPLLFTQRQIQDLIGFSNGKIHFGEKANIAAENQQTIDNYSESNYLEEVIDRYYRLDLKDLKEDSYLFHKIGLSDFSDFKVLLNLYNLSKEIRTDTYRRTQDLVTADLSVDLQQLAKAKNLLSPTFAHKQFRFVNLTYFKVVTSLRNLILTHLQKPVAAVRPYFVPTLDKLDSAIKNNFPDDYFQSIVDVANSKTVASFLNESAMASSILPLFPPDAASTLIFSLILYVTIIERNASLLAFCLLNERTEDYPDGMIDILIQYLTKEKEYEESNGPTQKKDLFISTMYQSFCSIVHLNEGVVVKEDHKKYQLNFTLNNKPLEKSPIDFFSESEIKRLCLAVVSALVKSGDYNSLILDDPIDSYDDYYVVLICRHIADLLSDTRLKHWYLLTNNYQAMYCFSKMLGCGGVIFYEKPDYVFTNVLVTDHFIAEPEDISEANSSDIAVIGKAVNSEKITFSRDLACVALAPTLRNIKTEILEKMMNVSITFRHLFKFRGNPKFFAQVERIEKEFLHADPEIELKKKTPLTCEELWSTYLMLSRKNKDVQLLSPKGEDAAITFRKTICQAPFNPEPNENNLLNLMLKKMAILNMLKYDFEVSFLVSLSQKYSLPFDEISLIACQPGLGNKIGEADDWNKKLNPKKTQALTQYIEDVSNRFSKYEVLFNDFDHAMTRLIPPFLAISVRDLRSLYEDIGKL